MIETISPKKKVKNGIVIELNSNSDMVVNHYNEKGKIIKTQKPNIVEALDLPQVNLKKVLDYIQETLHLESKPLIREQALLALDMTVSVNNTLLELFNE